MLIYERAPCPKGRVKENLLKEMTLELNSEDSLTQWHELSEVLVPVGQGAES